MGSGSLSSEIPATLSFGQPLDPDTKIPAAHDGCGAPAVRPETPLIPTLLRVLCEMTGMRFAAIVEVTRGVWTFRALENGSIGGLMTGARFLPDELIRIRGQTFGTDVAIEQASTDSRCSHRGAIGLIAPERYVCVPIMLSTGGCYGALFAMDAIPAKVSVAVRSMFAQFAALIAMHMETTESREGTMALLRDEQTTGRFREQSIAIMGHDLRNPLQAIIATSELLSRQVSATVVAEMAVRIKTNATRMARLIDDVMDISRARVEGGIGLSKADVADINAPLTAVIRELQDGWPNRTIDHDCRVTGLVRCDVGRVQQVASNLIGNALVYGTLGKAIRVTATSDRRDMVLEVWNEGDPIQAENFGKMFLPFWRGDSSQRSEGLGLGLHICSQIVLAHGGLISVKSSKESGTTFTARFPL